MVEIKCYLINHANQQKLISFCGKLSAKIFKLQQSIWVNCCSFAETAAIDNILWQQNGFIPHAVSGEHGVSIGGKQADSNYDVIINLQHKNLDRIQPCKIIAAIINNTQAENILERYKALNLPITTYNIN